MRCLLISVGALASFGLTLAAPSPDAKFTYVDLKDKFNHKMSQQLHILEGGNILALEKGKQKFEGIEFQIEDGIIQLGSKMLKDDPEKVEGIKVGEKFTKLHILHACAFGGGPNTVGTEAHVEDDTQIGEYKIHYADKTSEAIPIVYGQDVRDWWYVEGEKGTGRAKVAWKSENEQAKQYKCKVRLYMTTWKNPKPDKKVISIDFIGRKADTPGAPFCLAMTLENQ
jgi:hypothetical protein